MAGSHWVLGYRTPNDTVQEVAGYGTPNDTGPGAIGYWDMAHLMIQWPILGYGTPKIQSMIQDRESFGYWYTAHIMIRPTIYMYTVTRSHWVLGYGALNDTGPGYWNTAHPIG